MAADWPVARVAEICGGAGSFWLDCTCLRRIFGIPHMLPRTIFPITTSGRVSLLHEVPLSKTHLVSGSVVRLTTFSRAGGASSGVGALRSFLTSTSVALSESGSTFSDFRGSRMRLLAVAKSCSFSIPVHRT